MRIITRYVLKEHIGPLLFALAALTSLLMLQYVARQLGNLVGKGLPWRVIGEFFVLSLPFTVAMTMPMAVLVATLHAFGRMASENEITAFKASGVRVTSLMAPVLVGAAFLALGMVAFNDQVLPRANHKLRMLQQDMSRTKPTLALSEQVLNQVTSGVYMRIGRLDRGSNRMTDVTLYDLTDPSSRKTIYADSGDMSFTPDKKDLQLVLFNGYQQELRGNTSQQLQRSYFRSQAVRVKDIGGDFEQSGNDSWKGDREKSICEMQSEYVINARDYERVRQLYIETAARAATPGQKTMVVPKPRPATEGVARLYCNALALIFRVPTAQPSPGTIGLPAVASAPSSGAPAPPPGSAAAAAAAPGQVTISPSVPNTTGTGQTPAAALTPAMQAQLAAAKAAIQTAAPPAPVPVPVAAPAPAPATTNPTAAPPSAPPTSTVQAIVDSAKSQTVPAKSQTVPAMPPGKTDSAAKTAPSAVPTPVGSPAVGTPATAAAAATTTQPAPATTAGAPGAPPPIPGTTVPNLPPSPAVVPPASAGVAVQNRNQPAPGATTTPVPANPPAPPVGPAIGTPASSSANIDPTLGALSSSGGIAELAAANSQLAVVRASMDSLAVEVEKKFALSVACIVFVLFGPPIALRFPRGGVGATLGVSLVVFGLYYICLMAGETLADDGKLPPWVAMWAANVIFTVLGLLLLLRIEKTADASRSGGLRTWLEDRRARRALRNVRVHAPSSATV